jgi:hypothetical protein
MAPEYEQTLVRACLAALARRAGVGALVVAFDEIDLERADRLVMVCDGDAKCVRIAIEEGW